VRGIEEAAFRLQEAESEPVGLAILHGVTNEYLIFLRADGAGVLGMEPRVPALMCCSIGVDRLPDTDRTNGRLRRSGRRQVGEVTASGIPTRRWQEAWWL
jgi:hypothetical protein